MGAMGRESAVKSISMRPEVAQAASDAARAEGATFSAWVQRAVEERLGTKRVAGVPKHPRKVDTVSTGRSSFVQVAVSPGELAALREAAGRAGMSMSEYVRARCCYSEPDWVEVDEGPVMELVRQVKRVGNNVNQIAFRLNAVADHGAPRVADDMSVDLKMCREDLSVIVDAALSLVDEVEGRKRRMRG